jgi:hypothetical protein
MPSNTTIVLIVATLTYSVLAKAESMADAIRPVPAAISVQPVERGGDSGRPVPGYDLAVSAAGAASIEALGTR